MTYSIVYKGVIWAEVMGNPGSARLSALVGNVVQREEWSLGELYGWI